MRYLFPLDSFECPKPYKQARNERDMINNRQEECEERKEVSGGNKRVNKRESRGRKSRVSSSNDYLGGSRELLGEGRRKLLESDNDPTAKHRWLLKKTRTERMAGEGKRSRERFPKVEEDRREKSAVGEKEVGNAKSSH